MRTDHAGGLVFELAVTQRRKRGGKLADEGLELHTLATLDQTFDGHTGPRWVLSFRHFVLPRGKKKRGLDTFRCVGWGNKNKNVTPILEKLPYLQLVFCGATSKLEV